MLATKPDAPAEVTPKSGRTEFDKVARGTPTEEAEFDISPFSYRDLDVEDNDDFLATIHEVVATPDGDLWMATNRGLVHVGKEGTEKVDPFDARKIEARFVRLMDDGKIWAAFQGIGLALLQDSKWQTYKMPDDMKTDRLCGMTITPDGKVWLATRETGALLQLHSGKWTYCKRNGPMYLPFIQIIAANDGSIWGWVGGGGLQRFKDGDYQPIDASPVRVPHVMTKATDGRLLFGFQDEIGHGGLLIVDGEKQNQLTKDNSPLPTNYITGLGYTPDGALWIGLHDQGVARVHRGEWQFFKNELFKENPNTPSTVDDLKTSQDGSVWVKSLGGKWAYRIRPKQDITSDTAKPAAEPKDSTSKTGDKSETGVAKVMPKDSPNSPIKTDTRPPRKGPAPKPDNVMPHGNEISSVAVSADGNLIAVLSTVAGSAKMWDLQSGDSQELVPPNAQGNTLRCVALSPDGSRAAIGSRLDNLVAGFDTQSGELLFEKKYATEVNAIAFSPDGQLLALACGERLNGNGALILCDTKSGEPQATLSIGDKPKQILSVAFSPDGRFVATGAERGMIRVWDIAAEEVVATVTGHVSGISGLGFGPEGKWLASAAEDNTARIWDPKSGEQLKELRPTGNPVDLVVSPDRSRIACCGEHYVTVFDAESGTVIGELEDLKGNFKCVAFQSESRLLAGGGDIGSTVWKILELK